MLDTIYTLNDCAKRGLLHRQKASALWCNDELYAHCVAPFDSDCRFEVRGCDGEHSFATSNRRVLLKKYPEFVSEFQGDLLIEEPAALRWAYRRKSHPLHAKAVALCEAINALSDYPLVDEMDHGELEYEWASEAVEQAWEDACEEAVDQETGSFKSQWTKEDFNLIQFKEEWIKDAMSSEWHVRSKEDVQFQGDPKARLRHYIARHIENWKDELTPDTNPCPLDAAAALARISELSSQTWASPRHTIEAWEAIVAIVMDIKVAL